jgi:aerobic-type carbon monoxide dehydrogenase small subunit (CoxS/CutS family)
MASLNVNGKNYIVNVPDDMLLLWVLRDNLKLRMRFMYGSY